MKNGRSKPKKQESLSSLYVDTDRDLKIILSNPYSGAAVFLVDGVRDLRKVKGNLNFKIKTTSQG